MIHMDVLIKQAIDVFSHGGIVIFPTDTAYGIGCRIDNHKSVDRLFDIRNRPRSQAMPVLVASKEMANEYFSNPDPIVNEYMNTYWPGGLTIVAPCKIDRFYAPIRGNSDTIGLRQPKNQMLCTIIEALGVPILGPSANFHGKETPFSENMLDPDLVSKVDFVIHGDCLQTQPSTVVLCRNGKVSIIRQGAVTLKM
jgi:L-threonylcarbamoyladenylate synthase